MTDKRIAVSLTQEEHDAMSAARKSRGFRTLSDFLRVAGMAEVARFQIKRDGFAAMQPIEGGFTSHHAKLEVSPPVQIRRNDDTGG